MKRYPTSLPRHAASSTKSSPDATRIIKAAQKLSRLFRTKRLATRRSSVDPAVLRQLSLMQDGDHIFHSALHDPAVLEKVYEESKLLDLYHDMILEDGFFDEPQVYISTVLTGLGMAAMHATNYQFHGIADRMVHRAPSMWKHLWVNRRSLLNHPALSSPPPESKEPFLPPAAVVTYPADLTADQIRPASESQELSSGSSDRLVLIMLMYGSAGLYKMRKDAAVCPYHRHVALFYWVCITSHIDASTPQGDTLRPVLTCLQGIEADSRARDALVREVFAEGSGVEPAAFCMRINQHAHRIGVTFNVAVPKEEDQAGFQILNAALDIACHPSILPSVAKHHCHEVYAGMMGHVMRTGVLADAHAEYALWYTCRMFSQKIMHYIATSSANNDSRKLRTLADFLRGEDLIEELACGVDLLARRGSNLGPDYHTYPRESRLSDLLPLHMKRTREILLLVRMNATAGQPLSDSMKRGARDKWWHALRSIQKAAYLTAEGADRTVNLEVMRQWSDFGIELGLDEEKERKRHEREATRRCAWAGCALHWSTPDESIKLKKCRGCGEVSYCGRECQKTDWNKGKHKERCRHRLKP